MNVRQYEASDLSKIQALHRASGFRYDLPDLLGQEFFSRRVLADGDRLTMAGFLRLTAEAFLVCDPGWRTPAWRMEALRQLHTVCHRDAAEKGIAEVNAFLPPQVERQFGRRLKRMGWKFYDGEEWKCFSYKV